MRHTSSIADRARALTTAEIARLSVASLLVICSAAMELATPWPLKIVIDNALGGRPAAGPLALLNGLSPSTVVLIAAVAIVAIGVGTRATAYVFLRTNDGVTMRPWACPVGREGGLRVV